MTGTELYMTLSYCWGEPRSTKVILTQDKLDSFRQEIDVSALPRIFQEAVQITERLNIEYLWIDALCILQDSRADWLKESAVMSEIYGHTFLNIAATAATNPHSSLFYERDRRVPEDVMDITATWSGDLVAGHYVFYGSQLCESSIEKAPLYQRAWAIQEREISPRILHFAADHIFWECKCMLAMDSFPGGFKRMLFSNRSLSNIEAQSMLSTSIDLSELYYYWSALVGQYSACHLTYESDKLIAVSALARRMMKILRSQGSEDIYLAGLWRDDLENGLLWSVNSRARGTADGGVRIQTDTPSPSWSWASNHSAKIWYPYRVIDPHETRSKKTSSIIIEEVRTFPIDDEFGLVNGGFVRAQGPLCKVQVFTDGHGYSWVFDTYEESPDFETIVSWDSIQDPKESREDLILMVVRTNQYDEILFGRVEGLLLLPTGKHYGQYMRVGRLDLELGDDHEYTDDDVKMWSSTNLSPEYYETCHGDGRYTISII